MRKIYKFGLLLLLIILSLSFLIITCTQKKRPEKEIPITIGWQIAWATQGQLAQVLIHTNILELNNLKPEFKVFNYGAPLNEAALAGEVDVSFIGDQPAIGLIAKSKEWKLVARLMDFRTAIVIPPDSSIREVKDLKGKTLAIPFGASTHRTALEMLAEAGLDPNKDVNIINVDILEQSDIVRAGPKRGWRGIDAFASWDHHIAQYEEEGVAKVLKEKKALGVVAMSEKFIREHPEAAINFLRSFTEAYLYYANHREQANNWFIQATKGKFSSSLLDKVSFIEPNMKAKSIQNIDIVLNEEHIKTLQKAANFAYQQQLIKKVPNVNESVDVGLAFKAKKQLIESGFDLSKVKLIIP
jgi:sulfonate transport system substrate-binding protein